MMFFYSKSFCWIFHLFSIFELFSLQEKAYSTFEDFRVSSTAGLLHAMEQRTVRILLHNILWLIANQKYVSLQWILFKADTIGTINKHFCFCLIEMSCFIETFFIIDFTLTHIILFKGQLSFIWFSKKNNYILLGIITCITFAVCYCMYDIK